MDKYLMVIMMFMLIGLPISFISPTTGEMRDPPLYVLFWGSIGGLVAIFFYDSYKNRKDRQQRPRDGRKRPRHDSDLT